MRFGEQIFIVASFNFRWRNNRYINMRTSMRNFCTLTLRSGSRIPISLWIWYHQCSLRLHACLFIYFWINQTVLHQFFIICICANFCPRDWRTRCDDAFEFNRKCHQARELRYTVKSHLIALSKQTFTKHSFIIIIHRQSLALIQLRLLEPFLCCFFFFGHKRASLPFPNLTIKSH